MTAPVPDDPWPRLLETATLAPSPHNVQPWRIRRLDATRAQLFIERRRTLPNEDVTGSFIILTMGMFTEALRLAAAHERLALDVRPARGFEAYSSERIRASNQPQLLFADLQLEPDASVEAEYPLELFRRRRTSRLHYAVDPIAPQARDTIVALAGRWGQRHTQVTDAALIERLLDL